VRARIGTGCLGHRTGGILAGALTLVAALAAAAIPEGGSGRLLIGVDADYFPYEFRDAQGQAAGFNVDLFRAVARSEGLSADLWADTWSLVRGRLDRGQLDGLTGMFHTAERERAYAFSAPFAQVDYVLFLRDGGPVLQTFEDLQRHTVLVEAGTAIEELLIQRGAGTLLLPVPGERPALERLAAGAADAALLTQLGGTAILRQLGVNNVHQAGGSLVSLDYCFATRRNNQALVQRFDVGLAAIRSSGEFDQLHRRWFGVEDGRPALRRALQVGAAVVTGLLLLVAVALLWNRSLRRQVAERTRAIEQQQQNLEKAVRARTSELEHALEDVKRLSGLIPICASCKKVREDSGYWTQVEQFVSRRSEATFSHGICPDCAERLELSLDGKA
jgi:polar amino acid transport system substrate-binding protein